MNTPHDIGVAAQIGAYSDSVQVPGNARWLAISGTPGIEDGGVLPASFEEQAERAWANVIAVLDAAGFRVEDLVKLTQYVTNPDDIAAYGQIRSRFLGSARPASMLVVVPSLVWPGMLIEIEGWAARSG